MTSIMTSYGKAFLVVGKYVNERIAIKLVDDYGAPIATLTVNIPDEPLYEGEFFVKGWSENSQIIEECRNSGIFIDTGKRVQTGFVTAEVWKFV